MLHASLKTRVVALVLGLLLLGIWGFATHMTTTLQSDVEKLISNQLSAQVSYIANELDEELQLRIALLSEVAGRIVVERNANPARIQRLLDQRNPVATMFRLGLVIVNREGVIVAARAPGHVVRAGGPWESRDFLRDVMASDKPLVGPTIKAERFSEQPIISIAAPLHDSRGAVTGALLAPLLSSEPDLFGKLMEAKLGKTGRYFVFSVKDNMIISATDRSRIMQSLPPKGANRVLDRRLYENYEEPDITLTSGDVEVLGVSHKLKTTGWILVGGISTAEAFAPIRQFKNRIYVTAVLISLVLTILLILFLRQQMSPLENASRDIQLMAEGRKPFSPIPVSRPDEIGGLIDSFNRLARERQRTDNEIRELNRRLEERVHERTNELLAANRLLETEIRERKAAVDSASSYADRLQQISRRMVNVLEQERQRLARELHDRVSSNLTAIRLDLEIMERQLADHDLTGLGDRVSDCLALTEDAAITSREISSDLHPAVLDYMGIVPALKDLGDKFGKRTGIAAVVTGSDPAIKLPSEKEIALYRIAQEALMNCSKHAHAHNVAIYLDSDAERVQLSIADDGVGFGTDKPGQDGRVPGLGLLAMEERAEAIGARFRVESVPGKGTRVIVDVPA